MYSSEQPFSRPGPIPGDDRISLDSAGAPALEPEVTTDAESSAEQISTGLLMSFLTDFRSAEYELIRVKRAAQLEQSRRKTRTQPAVPAQEPVPEVDYSSVSYAPAEGSGVPEAAWYPPPANPIPQGSAPPEAAWYPAPAAPATAGPPEGQVSAAPAGNHYPVNGADFLTAASQAQDPGGKQRMRFGLASFRKLGQSPATA